jgi:Mrp family chromosome partitioning ATPase
MNDQANTLRLIASTSPPLNLSETATMTEKEAPLKKESKFRCLAITGGKGGVGNQI